MNASSLIYHCCSAISAAYSKGSLLEDGVFQLEGMSNPAVRRLINNLCRLPGHYCEVGSYKGSTLCSALCNNHTLQRVTAFENFSEFGGGKSNLDILIENTLKYDTRKIASIYQEDFFTMVKGDFQFAQPIDIFLYDGVHTEEAQYQAIKTIYPHLNNLSIVLIDDFDCQVSNPRPITFKAFYDSRAQIRFFADLPKGDFHGGMGLFVIEKIPNIL